MKTVLDNFKKNGFECLYHFTDSSNIPNIIKHGGLHSVSELARLDIAVSRPGGNVISREADKNTGMDKYVHLCFKKSHPMCYRASNDGRIENPVYIPVKPEVLLLPSVKFTAVVANSNDATPINLESALDIIDFEVLYKRTDWKDPEVQSRLQAAKKCEILVPNHIPLKFLCKPQKPD